MISIPKYISQILTKAAFRAIPELAQQAPNEKLTAAPEKEKKDWEYSTPAVMTLFNKFKKTGSFGFSSC
jgi:hypothetical protein